ncbi:MAG: RDD family protein [Gammaproteobacteria bacterium]
MAEEAWGSNPLGSGVYPKAHVLNRFIAKAIDGMLVAAASQVIAPVGWISGLAYALIADGFPGGQSVGKRLIGLQTVMPRTREFAGFRESIIRNLPLAFAYLLVPVPYVGWLLAGGIVVFEALLMIGNEQGVRLGDEVAQTQVLDAGQLDFQE